MRPSFSSLEVAIAALDAFLDERERDRRARSSVAASVALSDLVRDGFTFKRRALAPGTAAQYEISIRVHIAPVLGHLDANMIRPRVLDAFYSTKRWKAAKDA